MLPTVNANRLRIEKKIANIRKEALEHDVLAGRAHPEEKQDTAAKRRQREQDEEISTPSPLPTSQISYKQQLVHRWGKYRRRCFGTCKSTPS